MICHRCRKAFDLKHACQDSCDAITISGGVCGAARIVTSYADDHCATYSEPAVCPQQHLHATSIKKVDAPTQRLYLVRS